MKEGHPNSQLNFRTIATLFLVMGTPLFTAMVCNHVRGVERLVNPLGIFGIDTRSAEEKYEDKLLEDYKKQQTPTPSPTPDVQSSIGKKPTFEHGNIKAQNAFVKTALRSARG